MFKKSNVFTHKLAFYDLRKQSIDYDLQKSTVQIWNWTKVFETRPTLNWWLGQLL